MVDCRLNLFVHLVNGARKSHFRSMALSMAGVFSYFSRSLRAFSVSFRQEVLRSSRTKRASQKASLRLTHSMGRKNTKLMPLNFMIWLTSKGRTY